VDGVIGSKWFERETLAFLRETLERQQAWLKRHEADMRVAALVDASGKPLGLGALRVGDTIRVRLPKRFAR
jgi:hypothetical protein